MAGERALTIKFLGDGKDFRRMAKEAVSALDETESKGTAVARAMEALSLRQPLHPATRCSGGHSDCCGPSSR